MMNNELIIDAENAVLGRLCSYAAKQALQGKKIVIVNSEKAIILGNEKSILEKYRQRRARGKRRERGPFIHSGSDQMLKRAIRGMLPYKKGKGRDVFLSIRCFKEIPKEYEDAKMIKSGKGKRGMSLGKLSRALRGEK